MCCPNLAAPPPTGCCVVQPILIGDPYSCQVGISRDRCDELALVASGLGLWTEGNLSCSADKERCE